MPGLENLKDYTFKFGKSPLIELPLAVNPTGCARTEPHLRTFVRRYCITSLPEYSTCISIFVVSSSVPVPFEQKIVVYSMQTTYTEHEFAYWSECECGQPLARRLADAPSVQWRCVERRHGPLEAADVLADAAVPATAVKLAAERVPGEEPDCGPRRVRETRSREAHNGRRIHRAAHPQRDGREA